MFKFFKKQQIIDVFNLLCEQPEVLLIGGVSLAVAGIIFFQPKKEENQTQPQIPEEDVNKKQVDVMKANPLITPKEKLSEDQPNVEEKEDEDENQDQITVSAKQYKRSYVKNTNQNKYEKFQNITLKAAQHRMNAFKEDHSAMSGIEFATDKDTKQMRKKPNTMKRGFETEEDQGITKRQYFKKIAQEERKSEDGLFFTLYGKVIEG